MVVVVTIAAASITRDPFDVAGRLPGAPFASVAPAAPDAAQGGADAAGAVGDEWLAYGGTGLGPRYPLVKDITPETVGRWKVA